MKRSEMMEILNAGFIHSVKDVLWGNIPFTREMKDLLEIGPVQKLARIKQNGPTYHIYPGSVHTRLNHSIGVYHLSREILLSMARKNDNLPLTKEGMMSFLCASLLHDVVEEVLIAILVICESLALNTPVDSRVAFWCEEVVEIPYDGDRILALR